MRRLGFAALLITSIAYAAAALATEVTPLAVVDLASPDGAKQLGVNWRYADVSIESTQFFAPGADGQPGRTPNLTYTLQPSAGARDFDDSGWPVIAADSLDQRRGSGRLSFNWYRARLHIPASLGGVDLTNTVAVLETSLDDYAEVWVDGELPRAAAQSGGSVVAGWNATNKVVLGRRLARGREIQIAIFGMNGPISALPTNYIYLHHAKVAFYRGDSEPVAFAPHEVNIGVQRLDAEIDRIVPTNVKLFKLAEGFSFTEGPVWSPEGALLFSDPNDNRLYRLRERGAQPVELTIVDAKSGYEGEDVARYSQPGSNGLAFDAQGRLTIDQHGNRRVVRREPDGRLTVLADRFQGKRLNSPNDLVYRSDGTLYFTDPPFGLPGFFGDPAKELAFSGVYRLQNGQLDLVSRELEGPNGIAFSPDEQFLYVTNWDPMRKIVMRYEFDADGGVGAGKVFFDMGKAPGEEALDGLKVDVEGHLYVSGPGGLWIIAPDGRHLGTLELPRLAANFAWGGAQGRTLYITARDRIYRMELGVVGAPRPKTAGELAR